MSVASASPAASAHLPPGRRKARWSMSLGIVAAAAGFAGVTLALGVAAITLASLAFQDMDASEHPRAPTNGRGMAIAGLVLGIVSLAVWIPALLAIGIARS